MPDRTAEDDPAGRTRPAPSGHTDTDLAGHTGTGTAGGPARDTPSAGPGELPASARAEAPAGHAADGADPWPTIDLLHAWLDADRAHGGREGLLLRVLKLSEEVGEVAQAVIGATGQNPRKG